MNQDETCSYFVTDVSKGCQDGDTFAGVVGVGELCRQPGKKILGDEVIVRATELAHDQFREKFQGRVLVDAGLVDQTSQRQSQSDPELIIFRNRL